MPIKITNTGEVVHNPKYIGPKQYTDQSTGRILNTFDSGVVAPYERTPIGTGGSEAPNAVSITTRLKGPSADGKTLIATKGSNATLKSINCLSFDGDNDHVDLVDAPQEIFSTGVFEIETDILIDDSDTGIQKIFQFNIGGSGYFQVQKNDGANNYQIWCRNSSGNNIVKEDTITFTPDTLFNLKITGNGTNVIVKHDDSTVATISITTANFEASVTYSEPSLGDASTSLKGQMANFKMSTGASNTLHTHLPLQEGSGVTAYDISGNGNNATIDGCTHTTLNGLTSHNHKTGFDNVIIGGDNFMTIPVTLTGMQEEDSGEAGVRKFKKTVATGSNAFVEFGELPSVSTADFYDLIYTIKTDSDSGTSNLKLGNQVIASSRSVGNNNVYTTLDISDDSAGKAGSGNNSDWGQVGKAYNEADVTFNTKGPEIQTYANHLEIHESLFIKDMILKISTKIPTLENKTKQIVKFDGTADEINTGYHPGDVTLVIDARIKADSVTDQKTLHSCNGNAGYFFRIQNGEWQLYVANGYVFSVSTGIDPAIDTLYDTRLEYTAGADTSWVAKVKLATNSEYTTVGSGTRTPDFGSANLILGQKGTTHYFDGEYHSFKLTDGGIVKVDYDLQRDDDAGTSTITDRSGTGNNGTVTTGSGGLNSFWGQRVVDSLGKFVGANYAIGNVSASGLSLTNAVHNGSECSISFNSKSLAASSLTDFLNNLEPGLSGVWLNKIDNVVTTGNGIPTNYVTELVEYGTYTIASSAATSAVNVKYFNGREI